jgi:hypothetical protein
MVDEHAEFAAGYRRRVARVMGGGNPLVRLRWRAQLTAQENYAAFRVGRWVKRLREPAADDFDRDFAD